MVEVQSPSARSSRYPGEEGSSAWASQYLRARRVEGYACISRLSRYAHVHLLHARAPSLSIPPWCLQVRLLVTFTDDTSTAVHYYVLPPYSTQVAAWPLPPAAPPSSTSPHPVAYAQLLPLRHPLLQVSRLGTHLAHVAWLPRDVIDPFGRSASVMPWDRSANQGQGAHVLNDARAYDVGLSDDAGGGGETEGTEERTSNLIYPNSQSPAPVARILKQQ